MCFSVVICWALLVDKARHLASDQFFDGGVIMLHNGFQFGGEPFGIFYPDLKVGCQDLCIH